MKDPYTTFVICKTQRLQIKVSGGLKYFLSLITRHFFPFEISTIYSLSSECYKLWNLYLGFGYVLCYLYMH